MKVNLESFPKQIEEYSLDIPCEKEEQEYVIAELAEKISQLYVQYFKPETRLALHSDRYFSEYPNQYPSDEETVSFSGNLKSQILSSLHQKKMVLLTTHYLPEGILFDAMKHAGITQNKYKRNTLFYLPTKSRVVISMQKQKINVYMGIG